MRGGGLEMRSRDGCKTSINECEEGLAPVNLGSCSKCEERGSNDAVLRTRPKSQSLRRHKGSIKIFPGFKSLCIIPHECRCSTARNIWRGRRGSGGGLLLVNTIFSEE